MTYVPLLALGLAMLTGQPPVIDAQAADAWARVMPLVAAVALNDHENGEVLGTLADQVERVERALPLSGGTRLRVTLAPGGADRLRRSDCVRDAAAEALAGYGVPFVCGEAYRLRVRVADDRSHALLDVLTP
ncbi:MAG: hypothetical protein FJW29_06750 [Acidobacteria bacterium]|nr:hypothetical protein [Acidobacteriota bacterium]